MGLSTPQLDAVQRLVQSAPDALLNRLDNALLVARTGDAAFAPVSDLARAEADNRRARDIVLAPLKPLAARDCTLPRRPLMAAGDIARLWGLIREISPESADDAAREALLMRPNDAPAPLLDQICIAAAEALRDPEPQGLAESWPTVERERLACLLTLTPILRAMLPKLEGWVRNLNGENMAAARLIFKDAAAVSEDAGALFMDALMIHLIQAHHIVRLISAIMDRPSDRYLASSELAGIGERLLDDVDRRIQTLRKFDPDRGVEGGVSEAGSLFVAGATIKEFEHWLALSREGPWGARITAQKQALALAAEGRLKSVERAVNAALPLKLQRGGAAIGPRPEPHIEGYPNEGLVRRAEAFLAFLDETRSSAADGGFGALRAAVIESLDMRLDAYVQDLVERLREGQYPDTEWIRAYLNVAADFAGMVKGPEAAQLVRRRAAAA